MVIGVIFSIAKRCKLKGVADWCGTILFALTAIITNFSVRGFFNISSDPGNVTEFRDTIFKVYLALSVTVISRFQFQLFAMLPILMVGSYYTFTAYESLAEEGLYTMMDDSYLNEARRMSVVVVSLTITAYSR